MSLIKTILLPVGIILAFTAFTKSKAVEVLNYYVQRVAASFDGLTPVITLIVAIQNPSSQSFTVNSIFGNVSSGGVGISNVSSFQKTNIPANSQISYPLSFHVSLLGVALDIWNAIKGGGSSMNGLKFTGTANVDGIAVPVELNYNLF